MYNSVTSGEYRDTGYSRNRHKNLRLNMNNLLLKSQIQRKIFLGEHAKSLQIFVKKRKTKKFKFNVLFPLQRFKMKISKIRNI